MLKRSNFKPFQYFAFRTSIYTPKVEDHSRLSESWHLRHAKRAMSIDNISFISCAVEENQKESHMNGNGDQHHHHHNESMKHASTDNLSKQSDEEQENIIPWRAQLRKTNSRLSLVG